MIKHITLLILFAFLCITPAFAQTLTITKRPVTYKRPKPHSEYKRTFKINYPVVRGTTPAVAKRISAELDYFKLFDFSLKDELNEIQWLDEADFAVKFNRDGLLSVDLWIEGSSAYPDGSTKHVVIDSKTGKRVRPTDVFKDLTGLARTIDAQLQRSIQQAIAEAKERTDIDDVDISDLLEGKVFAVENTEDFTVTADGVTFFYDFGFPRVIRPLEPNEEFQLDWQTLRPYIRADGLLGRFIR
ncbi:DUF3298 domain-containing protein [Leptolyngbya sp. 7M]|uniref:DUF3298 domain-containing protein n=1 Tax=Leptolyngbya sp. 7M TaxID=2812896 RepID=UPI001B8BD4D9|nr:DUF3298 domain-containing protein [Leptolyngbya sp. 7M]QYO66423.1 RsiV family protein [Leptolyngbya sp. 7M]